MEWQVTEIATKTFALAEPALQILHFMDNWTASRTCHMQLDCTRNKIKFPLL